jgi:tetratricopeptide (TPR) repeat protein
MSKKKKKQPQHSPQHQEVLQKHALEQEEVHEVVAFFQKYSKPALVAFTAVCLIFVVSQVIKSQRIKKELTADAAFVQAASPEDLQAIIDDYPATPTAPFATIKLAQIKFNNGDVPAAEKLYQKAKDEYKQQDIALIAELGLITCKENKKQFAEAQKEYATFAKAHPESYLVPMATFNQARCFEALNKYADAIRIYDSLIAASPKSIWAMIAENHKKMAKTQL